MAACPSVLCSPAVRPSALRRNAGLAGLVAAALSDQRGWLITGG